MNTTIIENSFTRYRAEIRHGGDLPALATVRRHLRRAKAHDCKSTTTIRASDGQRIEIVDRGHGDELLFAD